MWSYSFEICTLCCSSCKLKTYKVRADDKQSSMEYNISKPEIFSHTCQWYSW